MFKNRLIIMLGMLLSTQVHAVGLGDFAKVTGVLDGVYYRDNNYYVVGWACQSQVSKSIAVDVYVDGTKLKSGLANTAAEQAVSERCGSMIREHRFYIPLSYSEISKYAGKTVQVRANGTSNLPGREAQVPSQLPLSYIARNTKSSDITIPKGITAAIDGNIDKGNLTVEGKLACPNSGNFEVKVENIMVHGDKAELVCGTEQQPFAGNISFIFKGNRAMSDTAKPGKEFMAMHGGTIRLTGASGKSGYVKLNKTANVGVNSITLDRAVSWQVGDSIVIAPSSFNYLEAETANITAVSSDRKTITLSKNLQYRHWGETENFNNGKTGADARSWMLDERAEVANLTRNIKVMSEEDANTRNYIGAHMMIMESAFGYINNVEFTRVGQMGVMGRYPFHWHIAGNVKGQYIKNSSIHDSYQRCITIHESHYALVESNTCYNHYGNGYFLEDGNERKNIIRGNLGLVSKRVPMDRYLLDSDAVVRNANRFPPPATFWITHPDNQVTHNVAAGSQGTGFWMAFHKELDCDSATACAGFSSNLPPYLTDTLQFSDNVSHSSAVGLTFDGGPVGKLTNNPRNPNDRMIDLVYYTPKTPPIFSNFLIYKNNQTGHYYRGNQAIFKNFIYADNKVSAFWAFNQELYDSLFVGISKNWQNSEFASVGVMNGLLQYDGPFILNNVHFANYPAQPVLIDGKDYTPAAISLTVGAASRYANKSSKLSFNPAPLRRMGVENGRTDVTDIATTILQDQDGSLAGTAGALVHANIPFNRDGTCVTNPYDDASIACQHKAGNVWLSLLDADNKSAYFSKYKVSRSDGAAPDKSNYSHKFNVILGQNFSYNLSEIGWQPLVDKQLSLGFITGEPNSPATFVNLSNMPSSCVVSSAGKVLAEVANQDALNALHSTGYYRKGEVLHLKLFANTEGGILTRAANSGLPTTGPEMGKTWRGAAVVKCH